MTLQVECSSGKNHEGGKYLGNWSLGNTVLIQPSVWTDEKTKDQGA